MNGRDVSAILDTTLGPAVRVLGGRRSRPYPLTYTIPGGQTVVRVNFQLSRNLWDNDIGNRFTGWVTELTKGPEPEVSRGFQIAQIASDEQRQRMRLFQNGVIRRYDIPAGHPHLRPELINTLGRLILPSDDPYPQDEQFWMQYSDAQDVEAWGFFLAEELPTLVERIKRWPEIYKEWFG